MSRFALFVSLLCTLSIAQNIKWTGQEGGWIELINSNFDNAEAASYFRPSQGQTVRRLTCGSEGGSISPSAARGALTWSMSGIPSFTEIYVKVRFGFIDSWENEEAYITINGVDIWRKRSTSDRGNHNIHVCGRTTRTDELETIERRLRLAAPATALTIVVGANLDQPVDNEFFVISEFIVYAHAASNGAVFNPNNVVVRDPAAQQPAATNVYTSAFRMGAASFWVDNNNRAVAPFTCGPEVSLRGGRGYLQYITAPLATPFTRVRVRMRFGFLDSWDGEAATITVNGQQVWRQTSTAPAAGASAATVTASGHVANVCGDGSRPPRSNDRFVDVDAEIAVSPAADRRLTLRVSSTLDQDVDNESFVISNVRVDVR